MKGIIINIICGVVGSVLGAFIITQIKRIKTNKEKREHKRFWNLKSKNKRIAIIHPLYCEANKEMVVQVDFMAIQEINVLLKKVHNIDPLIQDEKESIPQDTDLVYMCGPKANEQSKNFSKRVNLPFKINLKTLDDAGQEIYYFEDQKGNQYISPSDEKDRRNVDLALVGRYTENSRRIFLFWGIHGFGTLGATKFIQEDKNLMNIWQKAEDKDFAVLVEVSYTKPRYVGEVTMHTPIKIINH
jgi:hypothetical protein